MAAVSRILVDKEKIEKNGVLYYRLYFFDAMDGKTIMYESPVFKSNKMLKTSEDENIPELIIEEQPKESAVDEEEGSNVEEVVIANIEEEDEDKPLIV